MKSIVTKKRVFVVGLLAFTIWCWLFLKINHQFPQAEVIEYTMNQWVTLQDSLEIKVENLTFMNDKEIRNTKGIPPRLLFEDEMKLVWVTFSVRNKGIEPVKKDIGTLSMESAGWSNIADPDFMQYIKGVEPRLSLTFEPNKEQVFHLPYLLLSTNFRPKEWRKVEQKTYWLTYHLYPKKERIRCWQ